jgi:hypothetical protein
MKKLCWPSLRQKALQQCFLAQPDGQHGRGRALRSQHSFSKAFSYQRHQRYPREKY